MTVAIVIAINVEVAKVIATVSAINVEVVVEVVTEMGMGTQIEIESLRRRGGKRNGERCGGAEVKQVNRKVRNLWMYRIPQTSFFILRFRHG